MQVPHLPGALRPAADAVNGPQLTGAEQGARPKREAGPPVTRLAATAFSRNALPVYSKPYRSYDDPTCLIAGARRRRCCLRLRHLGRQRLGPEPHAEAQPQRRTTDACGSARLGVLHWPNSRASTPAELHPLMWLRCRKTARGRRRRRAAAESRPSSTRKRLHELRVATPGRDSDPRAAACHDLSSTTDLITVLFRLMASRPAARTQYSRLSSRMTRHRLPLRGRANLHFAPSAEHREKDRVKAQWVHMRDRTTRFRSRHGGGCGTGTAHAVAAVRTANRHRPRPVLSGCATGYSRGGAQTRSDQMSTRRHDSEPPRSGPLT